MQYLIPLIFLGIPAGTVIWFVHCLSLFLSAPKGSELRAARKKPLIPAAVAMGVLVGIVASLLGVLLLGVSLM